MHRDKPTRTNQSASGGVATNISGDSNIVDSHDLIINQQSSAGPHRPLTKTLMYKLLQIMISSTEPTGEDFPLTPPPPIDKKLIYNHAPRYLNIINEYSESYARLDSVIKEFPDSEAIIQRLHKMFVDVADVRDDGTLCVGNGDVQLKLIENEIYNLIVNDAGFQADEVPEEIINQFCVALIAVAVAKCRVLLSPGDDDAAA